MGRLVLVVILEALFALASQGAEPIRVENKCFVVQNKTAKKGCVCGDACKCAPGECPSKCPVSGVSPDTPQSVVTYTRVQWPTTEGRQALWDKPSDPRRPWKFLGYVQSAPAFGQACVGFK